MTQPDGDRGVYGISVAAELVGTGVQNLRLYETRGLLEPARTEGGTRRYSADDLDRELGRVRAKVAAGAEYLVTRPVYELDRLRRVRAGPGHLCQRDDQVV